MIPAGAKIVCGALVIASIVVAAVGIAAFFGWGNVIVVSDMPAVLGVPGAVLFVSLLVRSGRRQDLGESSRLRLDRRYRIAGLIAYAAGGVAGIVGLIVQAQVGKPTACSGSPSGYCVGVIPLSNAACLHADAAGLVFVGCWVAGVGVWTLAAINGADRS